MFLSELKSKEKELFLDLCIHAANANQVFAEDEKEMIQSYCAEMQIAPPDSYEKSVEETVREVNSISDMKSKKIIVLELLGLVLVDKEYDIKEKEFIYQVSDEIGIGRDTLEEITEKLKEYLHLCEELGELILK